MRHTTKQNSDTLKTYLKLMRASDRIAEQCQRHLANHQLTSSQFAVLEALHHLGPLCQKGIGEKLQKSRGNMTTVINNLEKRKLVKRRRDGKDKRYYSVELTPAGKQLIEDIFPQHAAGIVRSLNPLTPAEQHELARLCRKLGLSCSN